MEPPKIGEFAHVGKSVAIKGEVSGSEDLYIDGRVEGAIDLQGGSLTVGPNGQVRANVNAKTVIIHGKLEGNIRASDRAELRKSALIVGDIATQRIAIEEGAYFKGKVEINKEATKQAPSGTTGSARSSPLPKTAVTETK
jgi:cytoskeletal protein CcmA (bactofilin family)